MQEVTISLEELEKILFFLKFAEEKHFAPFCRVSAAKLAEELKTKAEQQVW